MYDFEFQRPATLADAVAALAADPDAKAISGGMTLLPALKHRLNQPTALVDLSGLPELTGIRREGDVLFIGAFTTHVTVQKSALVLETIPALAKLAGGIGDNQVRNRGTIGGSVANNDPAADYPSAVVALNATIITTKRQIPADEFFQGVFTTALEEGELVTGFAFPIPEKAAYVKMRNPASRYVMAGVFIAKSGQGVRVAVVGAGPGVFRQEAMEQALSADFSPAALAGIVQDPEGLSSDFHGSAEYRAHLVTVMAKRAVAELV